MRGVFRGLFRKSVSGVCFAKVELPSLTWSWSPKQIQTHIHIPSLKLTVRTWKWMNIVPFGMAYIQVRLLFVSGFTTIDCFSLPRNALQVDCLRKRNFDEVEEVHLMHGVVLHRWWPGGRRGWLCVWALARMKPITYTPSCNLKLTANAPKNRQSQKETHLPTIHFRGCNQPAEYHTRINSMEDVKNRSCTSSKVPLNLW